MSDTGAKLIADAINGLSNAVTGVASVYLFGALWRWLFGGRER